MWKPNAAESCHDFKKTQNRLSVLEKYQALKAFEKFGNFTMVCRLFNCGVDQIRSIVVNKEKVMAQHNRAQKIIILGKVVYEWFLRARRRLSMRITNKMIQDKAREVRKAMDIDYTFVANNPWLAEFRQMYNITDNDMKHRKNEAGPSELDINVIIAEVVERERNNAPSSPSYDILGCIEDSLESSKLQLSTNETLTRSQTSDSTSSAGNDDEPKSTKSLNTGKEHSDGIRVQNRLSLFDKLQALKAYEQMRNYTKVARLFNCSTDQIKSTVINKQKFLDKYGSLPSQIRDQYEETQRRRAERIVLLNKSVYEWFLRAQRNRSIDSFSKNFSFFQKIAIEAKRVLYIDNFFPNNAWLSQFLQTYNINNLAMKPEANDPGPLELDIKSIVADVVEREKNKDMVRAKEDYANTNINSEFGGLFKGSTNFEQINTIVDNKEIQQSDGWSFFRYKGKNYVRAKKVSQLGKVMFEWFLRARHNPSLCPISDNLIKTTALDVRNVLDIEDFSPNDSWLEGFRQKYNITDLDMELQPNGSGSSELDIEAIIAEVLERPHWPSYDIVDCDDNSSPSSPLPVLMNAKAAMRNHFSDSESMVYEYDDDDPPSKYMKLEVDATKIGSDEYSPSKHVKLEADVINIESDGDDHESTETRHNTYVINNLEQALEHLKPLEDFALMKENYRVIGLISQLEIAFKNAENK